MQTTKTIVISEFPPIQDIGYEMNRTRKVTNDLFKRYRSEENTNELDYALNALDGYCYVPNKYNLWMGRYVRYLSLKNHLKIKLCLGGFLVSDNGYTVVLRQGESRYVHVRKNANNVFFMVMVENDVSRIQMQNIMNGI
jgi:hypothetical protein